MGKIDAKGISRREFAVFGAIAAVAAGNAGAVEMPSPLLVSEHAIAVETRHGRASAVFVHPAEGTHPGLVLWPDAAGLREASAAIARELASAGLAVLMVDPYYRAGPLSGTAAAIAVAAEVDERQLLTDSKDFTAWLDAQSVVKSADAGYVFASIGPGRSPLSGRGSVRSAYLVAKPGGKVALTDAQRAALDRAVLALDRLNIVETRALDAV